ncbi:3-deoxy-7-phosphoheptulonate synthase [Candidatus Bathyarchaeota archaeon]|nr:3-deoxy-7-phosphoheptulonate synthase [Candidatus Bathyarchaeota archaeon]
MAVVMKPNATEEDVQRVIKFIEEKYGLKVDVSRGEYQTLIGIIGDEDKVDFDRLTLFPGVERAYRITSRYRLVARSFFPEDKVIDVKGVKIGGKNRPVFMAGPCAIESREQIFRIAREVKEAGADILRGGAFKPRTSVHSFQGLGEKGLEFLAQAGEEYGMPTVSEVRSEKHAKLVAKYVDILQIGARNMYNQDLIEEVARQKKPVLIKRNFGASIEEFLAFSERAVAQGNKDVILCERGIVPIGGGRQFTRYILDLNAVPVIKKETYLPIIVDPSHGTGRRDLVYSMSKAAIAAGAHGLMIETHYNPSEALSDGPQMVLPSELKKIIAVCMKIYELNRLED